ncbi:MAG: 50S ribosomal protein L5 [Nanobdellota archaeon]
MTNKMREIRIGKVTLNFGAGADQKKLAKGVKLIEMIAGKTPVKTKSFKRVPSWNLRPGLPIGAKLTLRGKKAEDLIKRFVEAKDYSLSIKNFDENGNVSFGVHEYVDIPGVKYDPELGIMGIELSVTLVRPGFRIKERKEMKRKIPSHHKINKEEAIDYFKKNYNVSLIEDAGEAQ